MKWSGFIVTGNISPFLRDNPEQLTAIKNKLKQHAEELSEKVKGKYNYHYLHK